MSAPKFQRTTQKKTIGPVICKSNKIVQIEEMTTNKEIDINLKLQLVNQQVGNRRKSRYSVLRRQNKHYKQEFMFMILDKMQFRRKSYCFQVIKQFYLFPDQTISSDPSVDTYDKIFFHDENIHTMIKITQTKLLEAKLWAFLNLKLLKIRQKLQKLTSKCEWVQKKTVIRLKADSFHCINQYSLFIQAQGIKLQKNLNNVDKRQVRILHEVPKYYTPATPSNSQTNYKIICNESSKYQYTNKSPTSKTIRKVSPTTTQNVRVIYPSRENQTRTQVRRQIYQQRRQSPIVYKTQRIQQSPKQIVTRNICPNCQNRKMQALNDDRCNHYIHTVQGNCSLNVYNNCTFNQEKQRIKKQKQVQILEKKTQNSSNIKNGNVSQCTCQECSCLQKNICYDDNYSIEQRLAYLKKLEILSQRSTQQKI